MAAFPADVLFAPVRQIHGFVLACLVDASTGMILGSVQDQDDMPVPVAAAGTADVIGVLSMMTSELAINGGIQDVIVTLDSHYHLIRVLSRGPGREFLLLVTLERPQSNLAMALREIRDLSADIFEEPTGAAAADSVRITGPDGLRTDRFPRTRLPSRRADLMPKEGRS